MRFENDTKTVRKRRFGQKKSVLPLYFRYVYFVLSASFAEHVNEDSGSFFDYVSLFVFAERFVSTSMYQITACLSLC